MSSALDSNVLKNMTFYDYGNVRRVSINGYSEAGKRTAGGYLYFGNSPIVEGTPPDSNEEDIPGNDSGSKSNSGTAHGKGGGRSGGSGGSV